MKTKLRSAKHFLAAAVVALPALLVVIVPQVNGATLTTTYVRMNRMKAAESTSFRVVFQAATSQTQDVTVDFQSAWTSASGVVNGTQTVSSA